MTFVIQFTLLTKESLIRGSKSMSTVPLTTLFESAGSDKNEGNILYQYVEYDQDNDFFNGNADIRIIVTTCGASVGENHIAAWDRVVQVIPYVIVDMSEHQIPTTITSVQKLVYDSTKMTFKLRTRELCKIM